MSQKPRPGATHDRGHERQRLGAGLLRHEHGQFFSHFMTIRPSGLYCPSTHFPPHPHAAGAGGGVGAVSGANVA